MLVGMNSLTVLVIANPADRSLAHLERLPGDARIVVGLTAEAHWDAAPEADVVVCAGTSRALMEELWPRFGRVRWIHAMAAGLDGLLFKELVESEIPLTCSRGVFARSLGEFAVAGMLHFAKDLRRLVRQQSEGRWEQFDADELHGKVLGIVGYGEIGHAAAARARAFGMRIHALRRNPERSAGDTLVDKGYAPDGLDGLLAESDYLLAAAPLTPETRGLIGRRALGLMKETAVLINLGRGPVVDEAALVEALKAKRIKGAVLDVFDQEPLPEGHAYYGLENVLLSPHSADHTATWLDEAMDFFIANFDRWMTGEPLLAVADKKAGY
jgi:phosphoglycerate dehydrogenase-like enzyme